jgi:uncharacterized protein YjiS (DUF1127 family)
MTDISINDFPRSLNSGNAFFSVVVAKIAAARARRAKRLTLAALLDYTDFHLDDIGVSRGDVVEAIRNNRR